MRIKAFRWTKENIRHIHRHRVKPAEVEEAFLQRVDLRGTGSQRYILLGQSESGRWLWVVFELIGGGVAQVITARDMTYREKQRLRRKTKGFK